MPIIVVHIKADEQKTLITLYLTPLVKIACLYVTTQTTRQIVQARASKKSFLYQFQKKMRSYVNNEVIYVKFLPIFLIWLGSGVGRGGGHG